VQAVLTDMLATGSIIYRTDKEGNLIKVCGDPAAPATIPYYQSLRDTLRAQVQQG